MVVLDNFDPYYDVRLKEHNVEAGREAAADGDGSKTRDVTFLRDSVSVNRTLLQSDAADGETLNVGSGGTITIEELAETVRDAMAPELELVYTEGYDVDAEHTHASVEKAGELLGYEPSRTIEDGVAEFVEWYRENQEWYEPLVRGE